MSQLIDFSEVGKTLTQSKRRVKSDPTKKLISRLCHVTNTRSEMAVLGGVNETDTGRQDLSLHMSLFVIELRGIYVLWPASNRQTNKNWQKSC